MRIKTHIYATIVSALLLAIGNQTVSAQKVKIKTGIEVLKDQDFKCLEGKRVGLITNPTGVDNNLVSTIDILHKAKNVKLVALYGPNTACAATHMRDRALPT